MWMDVEPFDSSVPVFRGRRTHTGPHVAAAARPRVAEAPAAPFAAFVQVRPKVLIVDDCRVAARNLEQLFEGRGYEVRVANDGLRGLSMSREESFDLFVIDVDLPVINGLALLESLRKEPELEDVPILMMAARGSDDRQGALARGANGCLSKPLRAATLNSLVDECC